MILKLLKMDLVFLIIIITFLVKFSKFFEFPLDFLNLLYYNILIKYVEFSTKGESFEKISGSFKKMFSL